MIKRIAKALSASMAKVKAELGCSSNVHRWTKVINKLADGSKEEWELCQSCGAVRAETK